MNELFWFRFTVAVLALIGLAHVVFWVIEGIDQLSIRIAKIAYKRFRHE